MRHLQEEELLMYVQDENLPAMLKWRERLCINENWEIWKDNNDQLVFFASRLEPLKRLAIVDMEFTSGQVIGDFSSRNGEPVYPLQGFDIILFANWLANFGDLILHAAGISINERGYCFIGRGGVGKSTLAASLAAENSISVLGEDQVILRLLDGCFWVFGTPWHLNPEMCSPLGVPLEKLFFLERAPATYVKPIKPLDGTTRILQTAFVPYYRQEALRAILERLSLLVRQVPLYELSYQMGADISSLILEL